MEKRILTVTGMSCSHCETGVKNAMEDLDVNVLEVSASKNLLSIEFDPEKVSIATIKEELEDMDYSVV